MNDELGKKVLKGVSRSFYLTLRLLPAPMRDPASLGYLLARTSDTIADTHTVPASDRLDLLAVYGAAVATGGSVSSWPTALLDGAEPKERRLLERSAEIFEWLQRTDENEVALIREVVRIIISGQTLDLERFAQASGAHPIALPDDAALEDYAWRVAGCVGAFWTKLGFLTLGNAYANASEEVLLEKGISYGKGLQLVNILRDLPRDLAAGRCYLPVENPHDIDQLMECFQRWRERADEWVAQGQSYACTLTSRRLSAATALPAMIAEETLERLRESTWDDLQTRIKIPRRRVYSLTVKAFLS